ncbi:40144_t:CDS:1, partial [Gigaspora margarita]
IEKAVSKGLIRNVSIATKNPAFYRWHHLVDKTFNYTFESMSPQVFSDALNIKINLVIFVLSLKMNWL